MESSEVDKAEAVAVWYGSIDSTQKLNSTGLLLYQMRKQILLLNVKKKIPLFFLNNKWTSNGADLRAARERGFFAETPKGEGAALVLAWEASRVVALRAELDRKIDLAAANEAIFCWYSELRKSVGFFNWILRFCGVLRIKGTALLRTLKPWGVLGYSCKQSLRQE